MAVLRLPFPRPKPRDVLFCLFSSPSEAHVGPGQAEEHLDVEAAREEEDQHGDHDLQTAMGQTPVPANIPIPTKID